MEPAALRSVAGNGDPARSSKRFELLEECRDMILSRLGEVVGQALATMSDDLTAVALRATRPEQQQALLDAVMVVRENRMEIETRFRRHFAELFERRLFDDGGAAADHDAPAHLELVSDDEVRDRLTVEKLIARSRGHLDPDEVLGIRARFGALLDREWFEEHQHPASPEAVFEALRVSLAEVSPRPEVKAALLDAFEPHVSSHLSSIYASVNERLRSNHVLPRIRPQVQTVANSLRRAAADAAAEGTAGGPAGAMGPYGHQAAGSEPPAAAHGAAPLDARFAALRAAVDRASQGNTFGRADVARMLSDPTMFAVADIPVAPVEPPLVASLTQLQRGQAMGGSGATLVDVAQRVREQGSPLDQITVEIVSMVFDYIYSDRRLSDAIKQQLLRLQVVAVKAALLDRSFFARRQHPMRRLIDRIVDLGADPDLDVAPGSPLIAGLAEIVERIIGEFDADLGLFGQALEEIDALGREEGERRAARLEEAARAAALEEAHAIAQEQARDELGRRLDKDSPAFVREFLYRWWTQALARMRAGQPEEAGTRAWDTGLRTAEYLIWSVAPKLSEDIGRLAMLLPKLIRSLNQGLEVVEIPVEEREHFFDELLRAHAHEIDAAKKRFQNARAVMPSVTVQLQPDGTVRFAGRRRDPAADESSTVFGSDKLLSSLSRGQRLELGGEGEPKVFKLAWISPARKLYILSRHPDESRTFTGAQLAALLRSEQLRPITEGPTLDRAIDSATQARQRPQAAIEVPAALQS
jgi:hypothetical protein